MSSRLAVPALALLAVGMLHTSAFAQSPQPEYGIRQDLPTTGSNIRRYTFSGSVIPINKRYHELSAEERELVNGYYEHVAPGDEPPFPAEGLRSIHDAVRKAQEHLRVRGDLTLIASVSPQGEVTQVEAIGSPSREITEFAATVLFSTKFKPAVCHGEPCAMQFPVYYSFRTH